MKKFKKIFYLLLLLATISNSTFCKNTDYTYYYSYYSYDSDDSETSEQQTRPMINNIEDGNILINKLMTDIQNGRITYERALNIMDLCNYPSDELKITIVITFEFRYKEQRRRQQIKNVVNRSIQRIKDKEITLKRVCEEIKNSNQSQKNKDEILHNLLYKFLLMCSHEIKSSSKRKRDGYNDQDDTDETKRRRA